ncbi:conserved protein of unknown function [Pseudodesulfovibrio profundus]|uniref:Uncharacterized protein n=2 Tax=Pseudodesulfovibrio profundus TaxID=57320 RepID=A0A2C8FBH2_9BACT|nr:hypothetical protein [Desulfovibrio sp.]SOB59238.1 conserved protein of unknown function [Pseudodesulfovibrio profundus]
MSESHNNDSVLEVFTLGLKTWVAEIKWLGKSILTRFEISRLEKELEQEYGNLGRIAEAPRGRKAEKEMSLRQIDFLKEEIETLKDELIRDREERMSKLREQQS